MPLIWKVLPQKTKRGNSNTAQRIALIYRLLCIMPATDIEVLTMDREFVGEKWFKYLNKKGIGFIARIKMNCQISGQRADHLAAAFAMQVSIRSLASICFSPVRRCKTRAPIICCSRVTVVEDSRH